MLKEFKEFALRGNVIDMSVGIIIGASFGKIVTSLVSDILMPPLGLVMGKMDFANLFLDLGHHGYTSIAQAKAAGAATVNYGMFINNVIDFILVAFALFILIRQVNRWTKKLGPATAEAVAVTKPCKYCVSSIPLAATRCPFCTSELSA